MSNSLKLTNVSKSFGEAKIIQNLNLDIKKNERQNTTTNNEASNYNNNWMVIYIWN